MAKLSVDIVKLYGDYFGYIGFPFIPGQKEIPNYKAEDFQDIPFLESDSYSNKKDILGRPVFDNVILDNIDFGIVMISLNAAKTIIKTAVAGRNGTVKESISTKDYQLSVKGVLFNFETNNYPETQVKQLKELFDKNKSISISSRLADIFEISKVVAESLNIEESKHQNTQAFSMNLVSDDDFAAILNE